MGSERFSLVRKWVNHLRTDKIFVTLCGYNVNDLNWRVSAY
jgi:hypothetical protein